MKILRILLVCFSLTLGLSTLSSNQVQAQCAMCSLNAENSTQHGNTQGKGLNNGILFLLAMPFLVGGTVAIVWYKKFRHKETKSSIL